MKKFGIIAFVCIGLFSCKEEKKEMVNEDLKEDKTTTSTYAEISMKEGGYWEGREYMEGEFKNVQELKVPSEHTDHSWFIRYEGPGWENQQIGYRLYLDWRNAIDIFGKKVDSMVLPYVGQDGFDSYHEPADWGLDILKAGKSMGIGGYGRIVADTVAHFRTVKNTTATIDNTDEHSSVTISYKEWVTGNDTINLETTLSIFPYDRFTKAELNPSKQIQGLCTGIVKAEGIPIIKKEAQKWGYIATYGEQTLVNENDKLGMAVFYKMDQLAEQKEGVNDHLVIFKPTPTPLTYYFLGAWEQEPNGITNKEDFVNDLDQKLEKLETSNTL